MNNQPPGSPPPMGPNGQNPYEFINSPGQPSQRRILPGGNSKQTRIIMVVAGVILLIIIAAVVNTLLGSAEKAIKNDVTSALAQQTELIRISAIGEKEASDNDVKALATTVSLTLTTDKEQLVTISKKAKLNIDPKQVALGKNTKTDTALEQAKQINNFDSAFSEVVEKQLRAYQQTLQRIHNASQSPGTQESLKQMFNNVELIIGKEETDVGLLLSPALYTR